MEVACHELRDRAGLEPVDVPIALERWRAGDGAFWLNLSSDDKGELASLLDQVGVGRFMKARCLEAGEGTTAVVLPKATFIELPVFADPACTRRTQVAALCLKNLLLTFQPTALELTGARFDSINMLELETLTTSNVLCALLWQENMATAQAARKIRAGLVELAKRMDRDPDSVDIDDVDEIKRALLLTDAIAEEQAEAVELLTNAQSEGFDASMQAGSLGLLTTSSSATNRLVDRMDGRTQNILQRYESRKQELLNRRIGLLTVLSAIFLPLTLLAGIWGMNFENMPELDDPYSYPMALGIMAFLAIGGIWFFYKSGWFD